MTIALDVIDKNDITLIGWQPRADLSNREWLEAGRALCSVGRAWQWWVGDWIIYGKRYGETYVEAVQLTGLDIGTLMNIVRVCNAVESSRRHENLSFTHHTIVADMEPDEQDRWLAIAEADGKSTRQLEAAIAASSEPDPVVDDQAPDPEPDEDDRKDEILPKPITLQVLAGHASNEPIEDDGMSHSFQVTVDERMWVISVEAIT